MTHRIEVVFGGAPVGALDAIDVADRVTVDADVQVTIPLPGARVSYTSTLLGTANRKGIGSAPHWC
jgi:hypothetical protein